MKKEDQIAAEYSLENNGRNQDAKNSLKSLQSVVSQTFVGQSMQDHKSPQVQGGIDVTLSFALKTKNLSAKKSSI